jgi:hypothetical protein
MEMGPNPIVSATARVLFSAPIHELFEGDDDDVVVVVVADFSARGMTQQWCKLGYMHLCLLQFLKAH